MKEVQSFLDERKQFYIKKKLKATISSDELQQLKDEAATMFHYKTWVADASRRAGQLSFTTHPVTLSHPSARKNKNGYATAVIADCKQNNDGYLRSGNVTVELDALGNAAALDVYKFLMLKENDKTLLEHIKQETELAKQLLSDCGDYTDLRDQFLQIITIADEQITSEKIKQVYVEAKGDYHLLSIVNPSSIMHKAKQNINTRRFSEQAKTARDAKRENKYDENGFEDFYDLTEVAYGGSQPQNISVLNSVNAGNFYLLPSLPPTLSNYKITCPSTDFFKETIKFKYFTETFTALNKLYKRDTNNIKIRRKIRSYYLDIFYNICHTAKRLRKFLTENNFKSIENLPKSQRIWLAIDEEYLQLSHDNKQWLDVIISEIAKFIHHGYKNSSKKALSLQQAELNYVVATLEPHKEQLR